MKMTFGGVGRARSHSRRPAIAIPIDPIRIVGGKKCDDGVANVLHLWWNWVVDEGSLGVTMKRIRMSQGRSKFSFFLPEKQVWF